MERRRTSMLAECLPTSRTGAAGSVPACHRRQRWRRLRARPVAWQRPCGGQRRQEHSPAAPLWPTPTHPAESAPFLAPASHPMHLEDLQTPTPSGQMARRNSRRERRQRHLNNTRLLALAPNHGCLPSPNIIRGKIEGPGQV